MTNNNMKMHLIAWGLTLLALFPMSLNAQTTEGKDFWVTFLQADQDSNNDLNLSLTISSRHDCNVVITNPYTKFTQNVTITANEKQEVNIYSGSVLAQDARNAQATTTKVCYAVNSERVDTCALHVTSDQPISLFASSYKKATFDATNVLPTASLHGDYIIQTYSPSDHGMDNTSQGSHFAVIAAEDNVVVDYYPTVRTKKFNDVQTKKNNGYVLTAEDSLYLSFTPGAKCTSPVLMKGQVFYVWTGKADWQAGDLSGTHVSARDGKKIAVFQGCPHTNIPYDVKQRDHIFSQAMPTQTWGNTFVLTTSNGRKRDIYRILALNDGTEVYWGDSLVHTFDFSIDTKQYWEFEIGEANVTCKTKNVPTSGTLPPPLITGTNALIHTSCPCAVHQFLASQEYDSSSDGDPAMLWINPVEQQIDQITFSTYSSKNGTTYHYANIVTAFPDSMYLDGTSISSAFIPVSGDTTYYFARYSLGTTAASHTLKTTKGGFIAHVYGFTDNESYAYSAGGSTKVLTQAVTINGITYSADVENEPICEKEKVTFACHLNYEYEKITWGFGDGQIDDTNTDSIVHHYPIAGTYNAYVLIQRTSSNICSGQSLVDSIPLKVIIGEYKFEITGMESIPCKREGTEMAFRVFYNNEAGVDLQGDNASLTFDDATIAAGFRNRDLVINQTDNYFRITIPDDVEANKPYGIHLTITDKCVAVDTILRFQVSFDAEDVMVQRYTDVIGLNIAYFSEPGKTYSDFSWYRDSVLIEGENNSTLNLNGQPDTESEFHVCYIINKGTDSELSTCSCPKKFKPNTDTYHFSEVSGGATAQTSAPRGGNVFVNADYKRAALTQGTATAEWLRMDGKQLSSFDLPDGGAIINAPDEAGLFILRVTTGKQIRNFKFIVY